jgi:hypothetical protein
MPVISLLLLEFEHLLTFLLQQRLKLVVFHLMELYLLFGDGTFMFLNLSQLLEFSHLFFYQKSLQVLLFLFEQGGFLSVLAHILLVLALLLLSVFF